MSRLFKKTLLIIILLFGVVASASSFFAGYMLYTHLTQEYKSKAVAIARSIATTSPEIFINLDAATIQSLIDQYAEIQGVAYVLVVGADGNPLAHTFVPRVPRKIVELDTKDYHAARMEGGGGHDEVQVREVDDNLDVSLPILAGLVGHVHVGMDLKEVRAAIGWAIFRVQLITFSIFLISVAVAYMFMNSISRPLVALTEYAKKVAAHDFSATLDIRTGGEIGTLAETMTSMSRELSEHLSEVQQAMDALRESEERFRDLFNNITDLVYTHDLQGRFLSANKAVTTTMGYELDELIGRPISQFMTPRHRKNFAEGYLAKMRDQGVMEGISVYLSKAGKKVYIEYHNAVVNKSSGHTYISGSGRDVTQRILAERSMRALEEQLLQAQKMEAVGTLASGIAHDFNNILQAIGGYVQLLSKREGTDPACRTYYDQIDGAAQRAVDLVRRLLTFSRKVEPQLEPVDLNREVSQTVKLLERTIPKMISIETHLSPDLSPIRGDANQLEQVIMNLASNARDAMPDGGRLVISTRNLVLDQDFCDAHLDVEPGNHVCLTVSDTGRGMDDSIQSHIFEPFFSTKGVGEGTGLGLSMVYGIVRSHRGIITCDSTPFQGTEFHVYLPAMSGPAEPVERKSPEGEMVLEGDETLLMVDDESAILEIGAEALSSHGYKVLTSRSGEEALEVYQAKGADIDLVILDLGMPGMGGQRCLTELLKLDREVRIVVASGYSAGDQANSTLEQGARRFLSKPYRLIQLLTVVREVLDS